MKLATGPDGRKEAVKRGLKMVTLKHGGSAKQDLNSILRKVERNLNGKEA